MKCVNCRGQISVKSISCMNCGLEYSIAYLKNSNKVCLKLLDSNIIIGDFL